MARTVRNPKIDTRSARCRLAGRREPFWTAISAGCALGYRRGSKGGSWIARFRGSDGRQHYEALGAADDARDSDGLTVFNFAQAQERARTFFANKAREIANGGTSREIGPYKVSDALSDYFEMREHRGSKGLAKDRSAAKIRVLPALGEIEVANLTTKQIRDWHHGIARTFRLPHPSKLVKSNAAQEAVKGTDAIRARRATANRTLTILKAALNCAYSEGRVTSDESWRRVKPFREVDAPVVRFLSEDECRRLVNTCPRDFRDIVRGALLTGCRYGELTRMTVSDFNSTAGTVSVRVSKAGKPRHVALTDEGHALFSQLTAGRPGHDIIFLRADGDAWGPSHQQRPLDAACTRAKIDPPASFHILRHSYASALAMRGVPMGVIAAQLGHADTRMTEKHYAHLSPSYVAETVRANLPSLGIVAPSNELKVISTAARKRD